MLCKEEQDKIEREFRSHLFYGRVNHQLIASMGLKLIRVLQDIREAKDGEEIAQILNLENKK